MMIIYFQSFLQRSISFSFYVWVYLSIRYNETWVYNAWQNTINVCTRRKTIFVVAIWEYKYLAIQSVKTQESEILNPHHVAVHFWKVLVSINYEKHDTVNNVVLHLTTNYQIRLYSSAQDVKSPFAVWNSISDKYWMKLHILLLKILITKPDMLFRVSNKGGCITYASSFITLGGV